MTEVQQTEMDCSDPLPLLSAGRVGAGGHACDQPAPSQLCPGGGEPGSTPGFATSRLWLAERAISPLQASVSTLQHTGWLYDQGEPFPIFVPHFSYQALP